MKRDLPFHIKKAFKSIERYLPVVDVIVELADARMPNGSRLWDFIGKLGKQSVIALSKADLADPTETKKWIEVYKKQGIPCVALDCRSRASVKKLSSIIRAAAAKSMPGRARENRKVRRVMVVGIPNVGKSTLINSLAGRNAAKTANMPGVTRNVQWIKINGELELLDLPGILDYSLLRRGKILKLINTLPGKDDDTYSKSSFLCKVLWATGNAKLLPGLQEAEGNYDIFAASYAKKMNFLIKGGEVDLERASNDIIRRFQSGGFGRVTLEVSDCDLSALIFDESEEMSDEK